MGKHNEYASKHIKTLRSSPQKKENTKSKRDSKTKVNRSGNGQFLGPRKVVGIRVDEKLYNRFKPVAQRVFGSVCRPVEAFMASILTLEKEGVNFGNTVRIEKLVVERNLRPRRKAVAPGRRKGTRFWAFGVHYEIGPDSEAHETNRYDPEIGWIYDPDY